MGIRTALRLLTGGAPAASAGGGSTGIVSPWQVSGPTKMVWSDVFGTNAKHITRAEAMTLPPVVKGRAILCGQISPIPLIALDERGPLPDQPAWLQRTDGALSPLHRMLWTIDDLIFCGWSLWSVTREGAVDAGAILSAARIPVEWWTFDNDGTIILDDGTGPVPAQSHEVILIPGPAEGLLEYGTRSIRGAVLLEDAWVKRAKSPIPLVELHETMDGALQEHEVVQLIQDFVSARDDENGMVSFTPFNITMIAHGEAAPQLAIEGRNFVKVDVANFLNLPASALDGSLSTASLTYSTQEGSRNEIADYSLAYWSDPVAARFSQDDVTAPGTRIRFDFAQIRTLTPAATGPTTKD